MIDYILASQMRLLYGLSLRNGPGVSEDNSSLGGYRERDQ